jgi:hypothetical protein
MSEKEILDIDPHFFSLVSMLASSAWCQLGKVQNPADGKIRRDLQRARTTIDILIVIRDKTKGNLTKKEEEILTSAISDLQINYADEMVKPEAESGSGVESEVEEKK